MGASSEKGRSVKNDAAVDVQDTADVLPIAVRKTFCAGGDDGHFGIKLVTEDDDGKLVETYVASRVAEGTQMIALTEAGDNVFTTDEGVSFTVSDTLQHVDTRFTGYALSGMNRVLVHHALIKAGLGGKDVRIVTGLPVDEYFSGNELNTDLINRKVANLLEKKVVNKNESVKCANIVGHSVQSEAIAAFYDLLINDDGSMNKEVAALVAESPIGFIDIGGKTTDFVVVIDRGQRIDKTRSGSVSLGGLSLNVAVENRLKVKFGAETLTPRQVENAVLTGSLRLFGKENDVLDIVNEEKAALAAQIIEAIKRKMSKASDMEAVYFIGGGSLLLQSQLKDLYPHAVFVPNPQFSNARGMFKIAKYMMK